YATRRVGNVLQQLCAQHQVEAVRAQRKILCAAHDTHNRGRHQIDRHVPATLLSQQNPIGLNAPADVENAHGLVVDVLQPTLKQSAAASQNQPVRIGN